MVTAIGYIIVMLTVLALSTWIALPAIERRAAVRSGKAPVAIAPKPDYPEPHQMSWIGRKVMTNYNELPEAHKPSFDFRAAIVALDVKYQIETLDQHFTKNDYVFSPPRCDCTSGHKREQSCIRFPEFIGLWTGIRDIERAMKRLADAEAERERKIELAGIENDLRSVDDILDAFRIEKEALYSTAKVISA